MESSGWGGLPRSVEAAGGNLASEEPAVVGGGIDELAETAVRQDGGEGDDGCGGPWRAHGKSCPRQRAVQRVEGLPVPGVDEQPLTVLGECGRIARVRRRIHGRRRHARSEERRVGKECRSRWSPYH